MSHVARQRIHSSIAPREGTGLVEGGSSSDAKRGPWFARRSPARFRPIAAPLAILLGFLAGGYLAQCATGPLQRETSLLESRYFAVVGMFGGLALMPSVLLMYALHPDWTLMYLANPTHLSVVWMVPLLAATVVASPLVGFVVVHRVVRGRVSWVRRAVWGVPGTLTLLTLAFGGARLATVALYDGFHAGGGGVSLFRSALFLPFMLAVGVVMSLYVYAVLQVRRHVELGRGVPSKR